MARSRPRGSSSTTSPAGTVRRFLGRGGESHRVRPSPFCSIKLLLLAPTPTPSRSRVASGSARRSERQAPAGEHGTRALFLLEESRARAPSSAGPHPEPSGARRVWRPPTVPDAGRQRLLERGLREAERPSCVALELLRGSSAVVLRVLRCERQGPFRTVGHATRPHRPCHVLSMSAISTGTPSLPVGRCTRNARFQLAGEASPMLELAHADSVCSMFTRLRPEHPRGGLGQPPAPACGCHVRLLASPAMSVRSGEKPTGSILSSKLTSSVP